MPGIEIVYPLLAHIALVTMLYVLLAIRKAKAVKAGSVDLKITAMNNRAWTQDVVKVSNNIANQFETPILFYVLCIIALISGVVDTFTVYLAWGFVLLRYIHSFVHVGSNYVPYRMRVFALSMVIILVLLIRTAILIICA